MKQIDVEVDMQKAIITKDLIGDEPLHYTKDDGWYYCKYFALAEEYCCVENDIPVIEEDYLSLLYPYNEFLYDWHICDIKFKTAKCGKYAVYEDYRIKYKIPIKFYKNMIEKTDFVVRAYLFYEDFSILTEKPLVLCYLDGIVGWLEPCAFEIHSIAAQSLLKDYSTSKKKIAFPKYDATYDYFDEWESQEFMIQHAFQGIQL